MCAVLDILRPRHTSVVRRVRYVLLFVCMVTLATLYLILRSSRNRYEPQSEELELNRTEEEAPRFIPIPIEPVDVRISPAVDPITHRANATLVMLARNSDINGVESAMRSLEERFNRKHNYPWVFLNEVPFTDDFKARVHGMTTSEVKFGLIPPEHWYQPDWIDEERAERGRIALQNVKDVWPIPYASSVPYRNMCRFNSGFFFRHELLEQYKWYWRVEPNVTFSCNIYFDPFVYMIENNKRYSFTVSLKEVAPTIPSLWDTIKDFRNTYPEVAAKDNALPFISNDNGNTYNLCHFWSNFEIADLDFFRSPFYKTYFDFLDATGNFYYERWGDAPVHSIGAALFLPRSQIHFFNEIGYEHPPFQHCPKGEPHHLGECSCKFTNNYDYSGGSCLRKWERLFPKGQVG